MSAAATAAHDEESGQYPVDWLVTPTTSTMLSTTSDNSPAAWTCSPPAQATCSECRSATSSRPRVSTTKVKTTQPLFDGSRPVSLIHAANSATWAGSHCQNISSGPTYRNRFIVLPPLPSRHRAHRPARTGSQDSKTSNPEAHDLVPLPRRLDAFSPPADAPPKSRWISSGSLPHLNRTAQTSTRIHAPLASVAARAMHRFGVQT